MSKSRILLSAVALVAGVAGQTAAQAAPPPWAPAHGYRAHQQQYSYTYYPARQIYYAPETRMWYWLSGNDWRYGARLPREYRAYVTGGGVSIVLDTDRPYSRHDYVVEHYGRNDRFAERHYRGPYDRRRD